MKTFSFEPAAQTRVRCAEGHSLFGLFVLFRIKPPPPESPNLWKQLVDLVTEDKPDAPIPFTLGYVAKSGVLILVGDNFYPYVDDRPPFLTKTAKLFEEVPYEMYFFRHPDVERAKEAQKDLLRPEAERTVTKSWPAPHVYELSLTSLVEDRCALIVEVPERADAFVPKGSSHYEGWVLYRDMPGAECPPVKEQVEALCQRMGEFRYPIGNSDRPYLRKEAKDAQSFELQLMNAVFRFQQDAACGTPFKMSHGEPVEDLAEETDPKSTWKFMQGAPDPSYVSVDLDANGVVDRATGDAIEDWAARGYRKPGAILVSTRARLRGKWYLFMRSEAAMSLYAWRKLTQAFGFSASIQMNHTYRSALVDFDKAGFGRALRSIHKTGLAVDVAMKGFVKPVKTWPIIYSKDESSPSRTRKGVVYGHRVRWRLFAPTDLEVSETAATPADQAAALEAHLREKLRALQADDSMQAERLSKACETLLAEPAGQLFSKYLKTEVKPWQYDPFHEDGGVEGPVKHVRLSTDIEALKAKRAQKQAQVEALQAQIADLKARLPQRPPIAGLLARVQRLEAEIQALDAKIKKGVVPEGWFVDLTALGEAVGFRRIGSFTNRLDPKKSDWGLAKMTVKANHLKNIIALIEGLQKDEDFADRVADFTAEDLPDTLQLRVVDKGSVPIADLDPAALKSWYQTIWRQRKKERNKKMFKIWGPRLQVKLSWSTAGRSRTERLVAMLEKLDTLPLYGLPDETVKTAKAWAEGLPALIDDLEANAPVQKKNGQAKKKITTLNLTFLPVWFQPAKGDPLVVEPTDRLLLPHRGRPIGMEWWHFECVEHMPKGQPWGKFLDAIGWTRDALLSGAPDVLYNRPGLGYAAKDLDKSR